MTKEKIADTLPDEGNTPANKPEGENTPAPQTKEGKALTSDENVILAELKKFGGRLTKLEQRTKDGLRVQSKIASPSKNFSFEYPEEEEEEGNNLKAELEQQREGLRLEKGVTRILRQTKYREILESDKTLSRVLDNNPLALLEEDPIDADDALDKLTAYLDDIADKLNPSKDNEEVPAPQAGPANPPTMTPPQNNTSGPTPIKGVDEVGRDLASRFLSPR